MRSAIDRFGNAVIMFNVKEHYLDAPQGMFYIPCVGCGNLLRVNRNALVSGNVRCIPCAHAYKKEEERLKLLREPLTPDTRATLDLLKDASAANRLPAPPPGAKDTPATRVYHTLLSVAKRLCDCDPDRAMNVNPTVHDPTCDFRAWMAGSSYFTEKTAKFVMPVGATANGNVYPPEVLKTAAEQYANRAPDPIEAADHIASVPGAYGISPSIDQVVIGFTERLVRVEAERDALLAQRRAIEAVLDDDDAGIPAESEMDRITLSVMGLKTDLDSEESRTASLTAEYDAMRAQIEMLPAPDTDIEDTPQNRVAWIKALLASKACSCGKGGRPMLLFAKPEHHAPFCTYYKMMTDQSAQKSSDPEEGGAS